MTIEIEAGASQLQCSTRPISAHLILTSGWLRAGIHVAGESERIRGWPTLDWIFKGVARVMWKC